jgi:hypothetical protein
MSDVVWGFRVIGIVVAGAILLGSPAGAATSIWGARGLAVSVDAGGAYDIQVTDPAWSFGGRIGVPLSNLTTVTGSDSAGDFSEISFDFQSDAFRHAAIRAYQNRQAVLFTLSCPYGCPNTAAFPSLGRYPAGLQHFSYSGLFANPTFTALPEESPWIFFDSAAHAAIVSAASNFMVTKTAWGPGGEITSGIAPSIATLPPGFSHRTLLVVDSGINRTFDTWGRALTDLQGKMRPANDADVSLNQIGYWTDNGASYYYHSDSTAAGFSTASSSAPSNPYQQTLSAVKGTLDAAGIRLGSLQLDSWFYPKGPNLDWSDSADGIYEYIASPTLFGAGLASFQQSLGIPLITHARWIDASSPYRHLYQMSGNVVTDPLYWTSIASYLKSSGVQVYEQDWLGAQAQTSFNLSDPDAFLDNMASAMAGQNIDMQYCMATPRHFLQTSKYSNLTSIRASGDRCEPGKWTAFLYSSRLASALGVWPFTDVFMSGETGNLIVATLSAGPLGIGDRLGTTSAKNLLRSVRTDGVIVKPDVPLTPLDSTFLNDSQSAGTPMIASTYSDFGDSRTNYLFAYPQGSNTVAHFRLAETGAKGAMYLYDYTAATGRVVDAAEWLDEPITGQYAYWIAAPVGKSGMAVLGDTSNFVSMGKKRVSEFHDDGQVSITVSFAAGEPSRAIQGYSPDPPHVISIHGSAGPVVYDAPSRHFRVVVTPGSDGTAAIQLRRHFPAARVRR